MILGAKLVAGSMRSSHFGTSRAADEIHWFASSLYVGTETRCIRRCSNQNQYASMHGYGALVVVAIHLCCGLGPFAAEYAGVLARLGACLVDGHSVVYFKLFRTRISFPTASDRCHSMPTHSRRHGAHTRYCKLVSHGCVPRRIALHKAIGSNAAHPAVSHVRCNHGPLTTAARKHINQNILGPARRSSTLKPVSITRAQIDYLTHRTPAGPIGTAPHPRPRMGAGMNRGISYE